MPDTSALFGPYWNGAAHVYGDPLRIYRRLLTGLGADPNQWLGRFDDLADAEAREKVIAAAGWALEMVPLDRQTGRGATESDVEAALRAFLEWTEKNGSGAVSYRRWSRLTAPTSSPSPLTPTPNSTSTSPTSTPAGRGQ